MPRPNVKAPKRERRRISDPPGYRATYLARKRYVTSTLSKEEHEVLRVRAEEVGIAPTTLATKIVREFLDKPFDIDAWQDPGENYPADETDREAVS